MAAAVIGVPVVVGTRGRPARQHTTRFIRLDGWPPLSMWATYTQHGQQYKVADKDALRRWNELRERVMLDWRGDALERPVVVHITFVGAKSQCKFNTLGSSVLSLLVSSGVIKTDDPKTLTRYAVTARRGPIERVEIRVRQMPEKFVFPVRKTAASVGVVQRKPAAHRLVLVDQLGFQWIS